MSHRSRGDATIWIEFLYRLKQSDIPSWIKSISSRKLVVEKGHFDHELQV